MSNEEKEFSKESGILLLPYNYLFNEIFTILSIIMLFKITKDLSKANNPEKYEESTD